MIKIFIIINTFIRNSNSKKTLYYETFFYYSKKVNIILLYFLVINEKIFMIYINTSFNWFLKKKIHKMIALNIELQIHTFFVFV